MSTRFRRVSQAGGGENGLITAAELAAFAYCPEQWRLQCGLGLEPANRRALNAGNRHHADKALAERIAGGFITLGRVLVGITVLALLVWLVFRR